MESFEFLKNLAIIIVSAKVFGLIANKLKAPQVVGEIIAGLLIGPCVLGWVEQTEFLSRMAEIGVVLIMFGAGLETNMKDLLKTGPKALLVALVGVFVPLVGGAVTYMLIFGFSEFGSENFMRAVFIGTIMTATSVGITVQTLKELGHLKGHIGTLILSSAIIDDIIGIVVRNYQPTNLQIENLLIIVYQGVNGHLSLGAVF